MINCIQQKEQAIIQSNQLPIKHQPIDQHPPIDQHTDNLQPIS